MLLKIKPFPPTLVQRRRGLAWAASLRRASEVPEWQGAASSPRQRQVECWLPGGWAQGVFPVPSFSAALVLSTTKCQLLITHTPLPPGASHCMLHLQLLNLLGELCAVASPPTPAPCPSLRKLDCVLYTGASKGLNGRFAFAWQACTSAPELQAWWAGTAPTTSSPSWWLSSE